MKVSVKIIDVLNNIISVYKPRKFLILVLYVYSSCSLTLLLEWACSSMTYSLAFKLNRYLYIISDSDFKLPTKN